MRIKLVLFFLIFGLLSVPVNAQVTAFTAEHPKLKVGFNLTEPIVFKESDQYKGQMIDLWEQVANDLNIRFEYVDFKGFEECVAALKNKEIDVSIAGTYLLSKREPFIDYTVPTFNSGQQILVRANDSIIQRILGIIFSKTLLYVLIVFCGFIIFAAHMIWLIERRSNPAFSSKYSEGIMESIWWTTVTLTTVGYGDKIPMRVAGKFFAIFWMLMGYFVLAYFTASVTAILTVAPMNTNITSLEDLKNKKVGTLEGVLTEVMGKYRLKVTAFENADQMYPKLLSGELDAIILDSPILKYYALHKGKGKVAVVGDIFNEDYWGLALQQDSPYREILNLELMRLHENGFIKRLNDKWFEGYRAY